ncbi:MAG: hypothetical protein ACK4XY_10535 [Chloroherpetonaceae bacterium]
MSVSVWRLWLKCVVYLFIILLPITAFAQNLDDEDDDEDVDIYTERFKNANGAAGSFGLTTTSFVVSGSFIRLLNPDWIAFASLSMTSANDPKEIERFDFFGRSIVTDSETGELKKNSLFMMPITIGAQRRLFREEINSAFRPFVEAGIGPTLGYVYDYQNGFFGGGYMKLGFNGFIGAGAYFGSNPFSLQGLSVRYQVDTFVSSVELLPNRFRNLFQGISLNLIFGTFFN